MIWFLILQASISFNLRTSELETVAAYWLYTTHRLSVRALAVVRLNRLTSNNPTVVYYKGYLKRNGLAHPVQEFLTSWLPVLNFRTFRPCLFPMRNATSRSKSSGLTCSQILSNPVRVGYPWHTRVLSRKMPDLQLVSDLANLRPRLIGV